MLCGERLAGMAACLFLELGFRLVFRPYSVP